MSDASRSGCQRIALGFRASIIVLCSAIGLSAQDTLTVAGEVSCDDCVIALDTLVTIGGLEGPGLHVVARGASVAVDRLGRILVGNHMFSEISVFDSTGVFLRTVGRSGEGPGEFDILLHIDTGPQYIHVFDSRGRTLFDYDFRVVRVDRFGGQVGNSFVTDGDDVVLTGHVGTMASFDHSVHVLSASGELTSAGGDGRVFRSLTPEQLSPVTGDARTAWVVHSYPNRLTRWNLVGSLTPTMVFDRAVEEYDRHDQELSPRPRNHGAVLDADGLWILWSAPDPRWKPVKEPRGQRSVPRELRLDSWLDLVDPLTGRTLARYRDDFVLSRVANGSRYLVRYRESEVGITYMTLVRPRLHRGGAGR